MMNAGRGAAAHRVLFQPELLEIILSHLTTPQLSLCQGVCGRWRDVIQTSPKLRWNLFELASPPHTYGKPSPKTQTATCSSVGYELHPSLVPLRWHINSDGDTNSVEYCWPERPGTQDAPAYTYFATRPARKHMKLIVSSKTSWQWFTLAFENEAREEGITIDEVVKDQRMVHLRDTLERTEYGVYDAFFSGESGALKLTLASYS
ncbi:hypothetical protein SAICODRAFT_33386 [Saitoella complicata NRRL Y-17804]|uniref:F-box domain-containing protein n=1 Tax=Saitoella complicata (strain BCRC 22490 / CBS 7301 / JCM 7358 / NBRC 10748 / NRRL Y-17804) TaxID=698492 RepID=A0A0E9NN92_SAICN|nr:uncharacterized protein SAICODRAFT_33386 [Saitoella complicata NRRL Y-17804]ODQ55366.1 hypothetical protein SAICODRAFT_33386 [Saitoella complicata NRRL Y-17804]GAO51156.1 hypothetical protein G7K_5267-t1 [Saitoella complicata NRRL Y-17804]